jgi:hypothetical protein
MGSFLESRIACRDIINRLKSGVPPQDPAAVLHLSVGCEPYDQNIQKGLAAVRKGSYDILLVEGSYGIGKSNFLEYVKAVAQQELFVIRHLEVGSGNVYFNKPKELYKQMLAGGSPPWRADYRRYPATRNNKFARFAIDLQLLADTSLRKAGLVLLIDEVENTLNRVNLPNFTSRANAYEILDILFRGRYCWEDDYRAYEHHLHHLFVVLAVTPGTLRMALNDEPTYGYNRYNPAQYWQTPDGITLSPLSCEQALELGYRIRTIHSVAFDWDAEMWMDDARLDAICTKWAATGPSRNERDLVKTIVFALEIFEQNR